MPVGALINPSVRSKLSSLRRAIRGRLIGEGLAWVIMALVAMVFVSLAFDYALHLDRAQRGGMMVLSLAAVSYVAWRELVAPLRVPMGGEDLALLVEFFDKKRCGQLGDRLISAIQFDRPGALDSLAASNVSEAMVRRVAQEANALAGELELGPLVERRGLRRMAGLACCALGLLAGFTVWQSDLMSLWFQRNVAFADVPWPQKTYLAVEGGPDFSILRGEDLKVVIAVSPESRTVPSFVTLHARYPSVGMTQERLDLAADSSGRTFGKVFQAVSEEFQFYVTGGDDEKDKLRPHAVSVIDPPGIVEARFTVDYPGYMNRPPGKFEGGRGALTAPVGGIVSIAATANKDIQSAAIVLDDQELGAMRIEPVTPPSSTNNVQRGSPRLLVGRFAIGGENKSRAQTLRFALKDTDGYTNRRGIQYLLQVEADLPPVVELRKQGVGSSITPQARVPMVITARDDCGVAALRAVLNVARRQEQPPPAAIPDPKGLLGRKEVSTVHPLELPAFKLEPGDTIQLRAEALDTLPESLHGPNAGLSPSLAFRIVRPEELMADLVLRQKDLSLEFVQAIALQQAAGAKTAAAIQAMESGAALPEARGQLEDSAGAQSGVGAECAKAAESMAAILEEMTNNRLGQKDDLDKMSGNVIVPLRALAGPIGQTVAAMNGARKIESAKDLLEQARKIADVQKDILARMEDVLKNMKMLESLAELENWFQMLIKWSEEVQKGIDKQKKAEGVEIFQPSSTSRPGPETRAGGQ